MKLRKPYKSFPLTPHASGRWYKKSKGVTYYFTGSAEEALGEYEVVWPTILATGSDPRTTPAHLADGGGCSLKNLLDKFRAANNELLDAGELSQSQHSLYVLTCDLLTAVFLISRPVESLGPFDFRAFCKALARRNESPKTTGDYIRFTKMIFAWGESEGLYVRAPNYGKEF